MIEKTLKTLKKANLKGDDPNVVGVKPIDEFIGILKSIRSESNNKQAEEVYDARYRYAS